MEEQAAAAEQRAAAAESAVAMVKEEAAQAQAQVLAQAAKVCEAKDVAAEYAVAEAQQMAEEARRSAEAAARELEDTEARRAQASSRHAKEREAQSRQTAQMEEEQQALRKQVSESTEQLAQIKEQQRRMRQRQKQRELAQQQQLQAQQVQLQLQQQQLEQQKRQQLDQQQRLRASSSERASPSARRSVSDSHRSSTSTQRTSARRQLSTAPKSAHHSAHRAIAALAQPETGATPAIAPTDWALKRKLQAQRGAMLRAEKAGFVLPAEVKRASGSAAAVKPLGRALATAVAEKAPPAAPMTTTAIEGPAADAEFACLEAAAEMAGLSDAEDRPVGSGSLGSDRTNRSLDSQGSSEREPARWPQANLLQSALFEDVGAQQQLYRHSPQKLPMNAKPSPQPDDEDREIIELKVLLGRAPPAHQAPQPYYMCPA